MRSRIVKTSDKLYNELDGGRVGVGASEQCVVWSVGRVNDMEVLVPCSV